MAIKLVGFYEHKKAWRTYLLSIPQSEALPLPIKVEQTTSEAHADMKNRTARDLYNANDCTIQDALHAYKYSSGLI